MANFCPVIGKDCIEGKCKFWQGLWNEKGDKDFNCVFIWQNILLIELTGILKINKDNKNKK
ncbi:hypothetical protein ES708_25396 [subsurface metagenome]